METLPHVSESSLKVFPCASASRPVSKVKLHAFFSLTLARLLASFTLWLHYLWWLNPLIPTICVSFLGQQMVCRVG